VLHALCLSLLRRALVSTFVTVLPKRHLTLDVPSRSNHSSSSVQ
jgi:hypothetical protein